MEFYKYGKKELDYLGSRDEAMKNLIAEVGMIERLVDLDPFSALMESIISQQISMKAAATIIQRVLEVTQGMTPEQLMKVGPLALRACGCSERKVHYILSIAQAALDKTVDFTTLASKSDEEIIAILTKLPGVGIWSAEMILLFSLQREDVLSYGDLMIRKGIMKLHHLDTLSKKDFEHYRQLYSPYGSIASLYLWEAAKR